MPRMARRVAPFEIEIPCCGHAERAIDVALVPREGVVPEEVEPPEIPSPGCAPQLLRKVRLSANIPRVLPRAAVSDDLDDVRELRRRPDAVHRSVLVQSSEQPFATGVAVDRVHAIPRRESVIDARTHAGVSRVLQAWTQQVL